MRLVDVGELIREFEKIKTYGNTEYKEGINTGINRCTVLVVNAPIVDAVPVVRCKDCKWWKTNYIWDGNERKICAREAYEPFRLAEDFCSRGERKRDCVNVSVNERGK